MRLRHLALLCVAVWGPPLARADEPKDPLRFVPAAADVVVKLERSRALLEAVEKHEIIQEALKIAGVRDYYDSTNFRRLYQLIAHFEKELGKDRYELLDALTGGGVVFAAKISNPTAIMVVAQAKDEALLKKFAKMLVQLGEQELARQESKQAIRKKTYEGIEAIQIDKAIFAIVDGAIVFTTENKVMKHVIDNFRGAEKLEPIASSANFNAARKSIPKNAHVWGWLNFETVRNLEGFKTGFEAASQDPLQMFILGGLHDVIKRAPSLSGYLAQDGPNWHARVQLNAGREGMGAIGNLVLPQDGKGTLPLLQPPRTFASVSYFMDLGELWKNRAKVFNEKQVAELDKGEKNSAKVLGSARLGDLLQQAGNHHRVVFALPDKSPYKSTPATRIPAFAIVIDMRQPQFAKSMNFILRGAALFGTFAAQSGLKMRELQHDGENLVCYYFNEDKPFDKDPNGVRFNFSPCFAQVGDQFVVSSTVELGKDLIDTLKKPERRAAEPATMRTEFYAGGVAQTVKTNEEQLLTQLILSQALPPAAARQEIERIVALIEQMGTLRLSLNYDPLALRFDVRWQVK